MAQQYTKEEYWKLYQKLPEELREAMFAPDTAEQIERACTRAGVSDDLISKVALKAGEVLLGILSPDEFQKVLEKEVGLKKAVAQQVAREINRFVFYPVKPALEQLHKMDVGKPSSAKPTEAKETTFEEAQEEIAEEKPATVIEEQKKGPDAYRESLE